MELIDNINRLLGNDLRQTLRPGARLKVAASCFSMYAFEAVAGCQHHGPFNPQLTGGVAFECFGHTGGTVAQ